MVFPKLGGGVAQISYILTQRYDQNTDFQTPDANNHWAIAVISNQFNQPIV